MDLVVQTATWLLDAAHWAGRNGIPARLGEHVGLSGVSVALAILLALPVGLVIGHTGRGAALAVNVANFGRALPSLAVIGIVLPITADLDPQLGFKVYPTLVAMVVLAAPPILVNAYSGVAVVDPDLVEAARGMGMRERQILSRVELPLALAVVLGGIRSAAVTVVATATLGALFGFGGLGRYLVDGIAQNDDGQIFGGVVLVAALALATELVLGLLQRALASPGLSVGSGGPAGA
jgi:osmoprotectant transport system permease protein